jgi:protein-S-isoprenylcysteine O-methyltransferase Ste14
VKEVVSMERHSWWTAGDVEYRIRPWIFAGIFFGAFEFYWLDHVSAAAALAEFVTRRGGNVHAIETLIFAIGAALTLAAAALRSRAAAYMRSVVVHDPRVHDTRLVADGPYRYVRNPLYLGTTLLALGIATAASRTGAIVLVLAIVLFHYRLMWREEGALKATQGEGYRRYLERVPRLLPSLRPRVPSCGLEPQWGQAVRGELFMWAFALTFVLFTATGSVRLLTWGCIGATAMVLLMRQWSMRSARKQVAQ